MTLKQFEKVNCEVRNEYIVFDDAGEYIETFKVNYVDDDIDKTNRAILRRFMYDNATVKHVSVNTATHFLSVTIIKKSKK